VTPQKSAKPTCGIGQVRMHAEQGQRHVLEGVGQRGSPALPQRRVCGEEAPHPKLFRPPVIRAAGRAQVGSVETVDGQRTRDIGHPPPSRDAKAVQEVRQKAEGGIRKRVRFHGDGAAEEMAGQEWCTGAGTPRGHMPSPPRGRDVRRPRESAGFPSTILVDRGSRTRSRRASRKANAQRRGIERRGSPVPSNRRHRGSPRSRLGPARCRIGRCGCSPSCPYGDDSGSWDPGSAPRGRRWRRRRRCR
jgi:hypothetical protein